MSKKRDHLVKTAMELCYQRGFHATGIDTIIAEAGIAKMTLYNHFASKEDLLAKGLHEKSERVIGWIDRGVSARALHAREKLFALFDVYEAWFRDPSFRGCIFAKAAGEYPDHNHPVHKAAAAHLGALFDYLSQLASEAKVHNPTGMAEQIILLMEGATTVAHSTGATIAARRAKRTLVRLMS